jgi:peptide/nickel transport system substrate-binding protein
VLAANPKYWDKSKQKFKKITFKIMTDTTARMNAVLSGQVDVTLLDAKTAPTAKSRGFTINQNYVDWKGLLILDRTGSKNPALGKTEVRQAIAFAIDRQALLKAVEFGGEVTNQVFGKATGAYNKSFDSYYSYNPTKAKQLLASAGYANGFTLELPTWVEPNLNALLEGYLNAVGIKVKWVSDTNWYANSRSGKYEALVMQIFQGTDLVTTNTLVNQGAWNPLRSTSPVITAANDAIALNPTAANIKNQTAKVNDFLVKDAWFVPFYRIPQLLAHSNRIKVVAQPQNAMPYIYNYSPSGK